MENQRVREACLICDGSGKNGKDSCSYCNGSGHVFSRTAEQQVMQMTGDCKMPVKLVSGLKVERQFTNG